MAQYSAGICANLTGLTADKPGGQHLCFVQTYGNWERCTCLGSR